MCYLYCFGHNMDLYVYHLHNMDIYMYMVYVYGMYNMDVYVYTVSRLFWVGLFTHPYYTYIGYIHMYMCIWYLFGCICVYGIYIVLGWSVLRVGH